MNDGTGKTIEEKRADLEIERVEAAARKNRRRKAIGIRHTKMAKERKERLSRGILRH